jgi:hypothetical protein
VAVFTIVHEPAEGLHVAVLTIGHEPLQEASMGLLLGLEPSVTVFRTSKGSGIMPSVMIPEFVGMGA